VQQQKQQQLLLLKVIVCKIKRRPILSLRIGRLKLYISLTQTSYPATQQHNSNSNKSP